MAMHVPPGARMFEEAAFGGRRKLAPEPLGVGPQAVDNAAPVATLVDAHVAQGGDWRSVIDGLRPYTQRLWRELPPASKRRFLEHARAWWDVHRHRMAPEVEARITDALCAGRLTVMAAKMAGIEPNEAGARVRYRRRGQSDIHSMQAGAIVDCTGIVNDPLAS